MQTGQFAEFKMRKASLSVKTEVSSWDRI